MATIAEINPELKGAIDRMSAVHDPDQMPKISIAPLVEIVIDDRGQVSSPPNFELQTGVPFDGESISIPHVPTLIHFDGINISDEEHPQVQLYSVVAIFAHGYWDTQAADWRFATGQKVTDVVKAYGEYAGRNHFPQVELVLTCNPQAELPEHAGFSLLDKIRMKLGLNPSSAGADRNMLNRVAAPSFHDHPGAIVESLGRSVYFAGKVVDGMVVGSARIPDGVFVGLDNLILAKTI